MTTTSTPPGSLSLSSKLLLAVTTLFGVLFLAIGVMWLIAPAGAAGALGATLLEGSGLATQLGDSASFFICSGLFMLYGVYARNSHFLMAGALLIGLVAPARLIAWQVHGAALTIEPIIAEILTLLIVAAAARKIGAP